jgi:hypothetical protein
MASPGCKPQVPKLYMLYMGAREILRGASGCCAATSSALNGLSRLIELSITRTR